MSIEWSKVRRAMLTQGDLFPGDDQANCMNTIILPEQMDVAARCIKAFYQGLKWADEFGIQGGYVANRRFQHIFLLKDAHILGVFDNRNFSHHQNPLSNPSTTEELLKFRCAGRGNYKTLIVLEKPNRRLANSEAKGRQSKFLIDVIYPALEGIRAKLSDNYDCISWHRALLEAAHGSNPNSASARSERSTAGGLTQKSADLLNPQLLADIYNHPRKIDTLLSKQSPLQLFYEMSSPFNCELDSASVPGRALPGGGSRDMTFEVMEHSNDIDLWV